MAAIGPFLLSPPGLSTNAHPGVAYPAWASEPHITPEVDHPAPGPPAHTATPDEPGLVYRLQEMAGVVKKRRSRTRRDRHPESSKPSHPTSPQSSVQTYSKLLDISLDTNAVTASHDSPRFIFEHWELVRD
jgi:hypothetical protein